MLENYNREFLMSQVRFYNFDNEPDLNEHSPIRAIEAMIAWCMVDSEQFMKLWNTSDFWKAKLKTVSKNLALNPDAIAPKPAGDKEYKEFRQSIRNYLNETIGRNFIYAPGENDPDISADNVLIMIMQTKGQVV